MALARDSGQLLRPERLEGLGHAPVTCGRGRGDHVSRRRRAIGHLRWCGGYHAPEHAAELPMADEDASLRRTWRGNALEGCRNRAAQAAPHDVPLRIKEAEIMARDPVPAEDDVKAWAQVQRGHVNHLTQGFTVAENEVDAHGRGQRELGPW